MAKGKNISIRFEKTYLEYALEMTGLKKEQELVDKFLLDFYVSGNPQSNIFNPHHSVKVKDLKNYGTSESDLIKMAENSKGGNRNLSNDIFTLKNGIIHTSEGNIEVTPLNEQERAEINVKIEMVRNENKPSFMTSAQHETSKRKRIADLETKLNQ